jgi:hypothetical protein
VAVAPVVSHHTTNSIAESLQDQGFATWEDRGRQPLPHAK